MGFFYFNMYKESTNMDTVNKVTKKRQFRTSLTVKPQLIMVISVAGILLLLGVIIWLLQAKGLYNILLNSGGIVFYFLLIPFALFAASFLFALFRNHAEVKGSYLDLKVELGGPVAFFFVLIFGGTVFQKNFEFPTPAKEPLLISFVDSNRQPVTAYNGEVSILLRNSDNEVKAETHGNDWIKISSQSADAGDTIQVKPIFKGYESKFIPCIIPSSRKLTVMVNLLRIPRRIYGAFLDLDGNPVQNSKLVILEWGNDRDTVKDGRYELKVDYARLTQQLNIFVDGTWIYYGKDQSLPADTARPNNIDLRLYAR